MLVNLTKEELKTIIEILNKKSYFLSSLEDDQLKEKLHGIYDACTCKLQGEN